MEPLPEIRLTPKDKKDLIELQPVFDSIRREIDKAKDAGFDVAQLEADFVKAEKLRAGTLRVYG